MIVKYGIENNKIKETKQWKSKNLILIDVYKPSELELKTLSENSGIPLDYLKDSIDEDERPRISEHENYSHIVYRAPHIEDKNTKVFSFSLFFNSRTVIILHKHKLKVMELFPDFTDQHKLNIMKKGSTYVVYWILDHISETYISVIDDIEAKVEKLENLVFQSPNKSTVRKIFDVKKILIYFRKAFAANRDVIASIEKGYLKFIRRQDTHYFREVHNDLAQLMDTESTLREILTTNLEIYIGAISNNMNEVMKKLTVYAAFILVPTLISGIYGMNFRHMPELGWLMGYPFAILLMIFSVTAMYIFFRRKGWI